MKLKKIFLLTTLAILLSVNAYAQLTEVEETINTDSLRLRCYDFITGGEYPLKDPDIKSRVESMSRGAINHWKKGFVRDTAARQTLWEDLNFNQSADITTSYTRLLAMTFGYKMRGTEVYGNDALKNDILHALDWMYANKFNERTPVPPHVGGRDNWWDYRIGSPDRLCNIMVMMYDELSPEQRNNYLKTISHVTPSVDGYTGANLLWVSRVIILNGILSSDKDKIIYARDAIKDVFDYVESGDGFYRDGSFIQHKKHAYTGAYGASLLGSLAELMNLLPAVKNIPSSENVYHWIYDSFVPLIYKGGMMSMSMGREISRSHVSEHRKGRSVIGSMTLLANVAPPQHAVKIKSLVKTLVTADKTFPSYTSSFPTITVMKMVQDIMDDDSVPVLGDTLLYKQFANMDRAVQHNSRYAFAISMHSSRTNNFEGINKENLKGWHTSAGMTYLYTADQKQFEDNFWPTLNYHRLPGTTIIDDSEATHNRSSLKDWVGGASMQGKYGVSGMDLSPVETSLSARKSWFMFDNEIVALGAGIAHQGEQRVVTTIEQRKLNSENNNVFTVNGEVMSPIFSEHKKNGIKWAHLEGNVPNADIGYYFPDGSELTLERKTQKGNWKDLREANPDKMVTENYLTIWKGHGAHAKDLNEPENKYSYVLLPGFSRTEVEQYVRKPEIEIIENTAEVQAVRDIKLNLLAANFWEDSLRTISVAGGVPYLTVNKKAAVMVMEEKNSIIISVSDPTMKNDGIMELEVNTPVSEVLSKDPRVTVKQTAPVIKITVDMKDLHGKTISVELGKKNSNK